MADKKKSLRIIQGNREALEVEKANEIIKALVIDKDRDTAFQIADSLTPKGALTLAADNQRKPK